MSEVFDFPVWEDCPFRDAVPRAYKIRRGFSKDMDSEMFLISYETEGIIKHVDIRMPSEGISVEKHIEPMLNCLKGALA